jgi:hypothetical protein
MFMKRGLWLVASLLGGIVVPSIACSSGHATTQASPDTETDSAVADVSSNADVTTGANDASTAMDVEASAPLEASSDGAGVDGGPPTVSPMTLDFGLVGCGSTTAAAVQTFTIDNPSASPVTWTASLGKGTSSAFTLAPTTGMLAPGQSANVTVTPLAVPKSSSTAANALGDLVNVTLNSSSVNVTLKETAQGAVLVFNPASLPFGSTPVGSQLTANFEVENIGNLAVSNLTLTLTGSPAFTLVGATSIEPVGTGEGDAGEADAGGADGATGDAAGGDATAADATTGDANAAVLMETADAGANPRSTVNFLPTSASPAAGSIAVAVGASDVLCAPLPTPLSLSGTGTSGKVTVSPTSFVLTPDGVNNYVPCGETALPVMVTIQNSGTAPFNWNGTLEHGNGTYYTLSATSGVVTPTSSASLTITPKAVPGNASTAPNAYGDILTITTNAANDVPHTVTLNETAQGAIISRSLGTLNFGNVAMGTTSTQTYTFTNTGNMDATLMFSNGNPAFVQSTPLTVSAGSGIFASESVSFQPTMVEQYSDIGLVSLVSSVPLCGAFPGNLALAGNGTNPTLSAVPGTLNFGSVPCGTAPTSSQTVTVTNNGPATTFTASLLKGSGSPFTLQTSTGTVGSNGTTASGTLDAGGNVVFTVTGATIPFPASTAGNAFGDTLQVVSGLNDTADVTLNMTALGSVLTFSKSSPIAVGTTAPNTTVTTTLSLNNGGNYTANVTLATTSVFGIAPMSGMVASGQSLPLTASFTPTAPGAMSYMGTLSASLPAGAPNCGTLPSATLTGTAN